MNGRQLILRIRKIQCVGEVGRGRENPCPLFSSGKMTTSFWHQIDYQVGHITESLITKNAIFQTYKFFFLSELIYSLIL